MNEVHRKIMFQIETSGLKRPLVQLVRGLVAYADDNLAVRCHSMRSGWASMVVAARGLIYLEIEDNEPPDLMNQLLTIHGFDNLGRIKEVGERLDKASQLIHHEKYNEARELLDEVDTIQGSGDPDVTRMRALIFFMEGD